MSFLGNVDKADSDPAWADLCYPGGASIGQLKSLPLQVTAIRETFEECGLLVTRPPVVLSRKDRQAWQVKVHDDPSLLMALCQQYRVQPDVERLIHIGRWCTPNYRPRRYDTHFFHYKLAQPSTAVETSDGSLVDNLEILSSSWLTPQNALSLAGLSLESGGEQPRPEPGPEIMLYPPQIYFVATLALKGGVQETDVEAPAWTPEQVTANEAVPDAFRDCSILVLPGDPLHSGYRDTTGQAEARQRVYTTLSQDGVRVHGFEQRSVPGLGDFCVLRQSQAKL